MRLTPSRQPRPDRSRAAFTLVEILVVVIIMGISAALVVPNIGTRNDQNAAAAARVVMADLMFAQNRAIMAQGMRYVNISTTNQNYAVLSASPASPPLVYEQNPSTLRNYITVFGTTAASGALQTASLQTPSVDGKTCIAFDALGQPYSVDPSSGVAALLVSAATIPVRCGTFTLTVYVEPYTGAISVQ